MWAVSIYFALFGLTEQLYQNELSSLRNDYSQALAGVDSGNPKFWLAQFPNIQKRTLRIPPDLLNLIQTLKSLYGAKDEVSEINRGLISAIQSLAETEKLRGVYFFGIDLQGIFLKKANLQGIFFSRADLKEANL